MKKLNILLIVFVSLVFLISCKNKTRFIRKDSYIIDNERNLMWTLKDQDMMNFSDAEEYCKSLNLNGKKEWRLPSISEWRSIIVGCKMKLNEGSCAVSDVCAERNLCWSMHCSCPELKGPGKKGCYWDDSVWGENCSSYWSKTKSSNYSGWVLLFDKAAVGTSSLDNTWYVKCVKNIK